MHESVHKFVQRTVKKHDLAALSVLEVGSYDVNGSVRELFTGRYIGVDLVKGPGVDLVVSGHDLLVTFGPEAFDVVVCVEVLEHDPRPWLTMEQSGLVLRDGGHLIVTTRGNGFPEHNRPDRYRFLEDGFKTIVSESGCEIVTVQKDGEVSGWFGHAVKRSALTP